MEVNRYIGCKLASSLPLTVIRSMLHQQGAGPGREFLEIKGQPLAELLKYYGDSKAVFLYEFGCAVFVDMSPAEIRRFLDFLRSVGCRISTEFFAQYQQELLVYVQPDGTFTLENEVQSYEANKSKAVILSTVLAKVTALSALENEMNDLFDRSENLIVRMQKGRFNVRFTRNIAGILRFQYRCAHSARIFDRAYTYGSTLSSRVLYENIAERYQYQERVRILKEKTDDLHGIFKIYMELSENWEENRLLYIEIFLLALFLVFYIF